MIGHTCKTDYFCSLSNPVIYDYVYPHCPNQSAEPTNGNREYIHGNIPKYSQYNDYEY